MGIGQWGSLALSACFFSIAGLYQQLALELGHESKHELVKRTCDLFEARCLEKLQGSEGRVLSLLGHWIAIIQCMDSKLSARCVPIFATLSLQLPSKVNESEPRRIF